MVMFQKDDENSRPTLIAAYGWTPPFLEEYEEEGVVVVASLPKRFSVLIEAPWPIGELGQFLTDWLRDSSLFEEGALVAYIAISLARSALDGRFLVTNFVPGREPGCPSEWPHVSQQELTAHLVCYLTAQHSGESG